MSGIISTHNISGRLDTELLPDGIMRWRREDGRWIGSIEGIDLVTVADDHRGGFRWSIQPVDDRLTGSGSATKLDDAKRLARVAVIYARAAQRAYGRDN